MKYLWQSAATAVLVAFAFLLAGGSASTSNTVGSTINGLVGRKLELYRESLPERVRQLATAQSVSQQLRPTLRFLHSESWLQALQYGFVVPELGSLFEGEAAMLFGNISYIQEHRDDVSFELSLHMLLATLKSFDPSRYTSILTAYPISRRAVMALVLERYLEVGSFTPSEAQLIGDICQRIFELHEQAAATKRIIEFFHVSKSGGTTFCQLGKLNGCKAESFNYTGNCMVRYFRDAPRWTKPGALGRLSLLHGDPWCARFGRQYSFKWHCRARRQYLTKNRLNFYSNELVMHDHNHSWVGVHPCREFLNVVIFREPEPRILSHMQNILKEYVNHYGESFWTAFDPASPDQWRALAVPLFDNYVVRSLLGGAAYNMPYGAVNSTHLLAAKVVALQFEVLLSLSPSPAGRELTSDIFGLGLGWHLDLRHLHVRATRTRSVPAFAPAVMEAVRSARQLDQQLYEFALVLQLLDAIAFGVAHEVGGVGVAGASAGARVPFVARSGGAGDAAARPRTRPRTRRCGYVGLRAPPGARPPPPPPDAPVLHVSVKSLQPGGGVERVAVGGLGAHPIAGGRWFNGEFYRDASAAEAEAVEAAKAAARVAMEAAAAAEAAAGGEAAGAVP